MSRHSKRTIYHMFIVYTMTVKVIEKSINNS